MISIIDYGVGNLGSILNMIKKIGGSSRLVGTPEDVLSGDKFLLPGVGHFSEGMKNLKGSGLLPALEEVAIRRKNPILGICLGAQLLTRRSDEGDENGLAWLDVETLKIPASGNLKVPHMGWNFLNIKREDPLLRNLGEKPKFYFVHSYYMRSFNDSQLVASVTYGQELGAVFRKDNVVACQFHPEKSHRFGMTLLKNFLEV